MVLYSIVIFKIMKKITLYLDPATLPALAQLIHFLQNKEEESFRIFCYNRYPLLENVIKNEMGIDAFFCDIPLNGMWAYCPDKVLTLINDYSLNESVSLEIHSNLGHSLPLIAPLTRLVEKNKNIQISHIHLYDDGSKEYLDLESLKYVNLRYLLDVSLIDVSVYLKRTNVHLTNSIIAQYLLGNFYPVTYHVLKKDYFIKTGFIDPIFKQIKNFCQSINFSENALSQESKEHLCKMIGLDKSLQETLRRTQNGFLFISGITYFLGELEECFRNELLIIAKKIIKGNYDALFLKAHPCYLSDKFNFPILQFNDSIVELPKEMPIEALMIVGLLPKKIGGINSSSFFSLPKENISHIIFLDKKYYSHKISNQKFIEVLLKLECVKNEQIFYWNDFIE